MVYPELKSLHSPDLKKGQTPNDPAHCSVFIEAGIGPRGSEGEEIFSFVAATPDKLSAEGRWRWGRGYLIIDTFSWETVNEALLSLIAHSSGETWDQVALSLAKELHWEFDGYRQ